MLRNRSRAFWRSAQLMCLATVLLTAACAKPPPFRNVPNYPTRWAGVESVTLVPPLVSVYEMSSGDVQQEVQEWSDAANQLAQNAVREHLDMIGKRYVPYAGERGPRPDFRLGIEVRPESNDSEQSWLLWESAKNAILRHTYDPALTFQSQMTGFDYTLGRDARSLLAGTEADAFLLMIATDYVPTADRQALIGVGAAAALVTGSYGGPGATPAELTVALVDSRNGDILFFNKVSMPLADLRDPMANQVLIDMVLDGMNQ